jgi:hypothetical protein
MAWATPARAVTGAGVAAKALAPPAPLEAVDEASAQRLAYRKQRPVLVTGLTTESSQTWAQPDGTLKSKVSMTLERFRDGSGRWTDVDLRMERAADGSVAPKAHPRGLRLSGARSAGVETFADLGSGAEKVSLGWRGILPEPSLDGPRATYPEVKPGVDLMVEARPAGFEYFLIVKNRAAVASVASVAMPWSGGALSTASDGGLRARTLANTTVSVPPALMWDARVSPASGEPVLQADVAVTPTPVGSGKTDLVLTPDQAFFSDPGLTFPVTIDPSVNLSPAFDAFIQDTYSSDQSGANELKLGYSDDADAGCGSGCTARSLLNFNQAAGWEGADVASAELMMWATHSWSCTPMQWESWRVSAAGSANRWSNQPTWEARDGLSTGTKGYSSSCADGWVSISVENIFQNVLNNSSLSAARIGLKASSESNHNSWKKFNSAEATSNRPYVELVYNHKPNVPTGLTIDSCYSACASPAVVSSGTPTLRATATDPNGGTMRLEFEVWDQAKAVRKAFSGSAVTGVTSGSTRPWKAVPSSGAKLPDATYNYRVRACESWDGGLLCGGWTATWFTFRVATTMPGVPAVTSTTYPADDTGTWSGGPGQAGEFTFSHTATDVTEYIYSLGGTNPTTIPAGQLQAQRLTANQQSVSTDLTGFVAGVNTNAVRSTSMGHAAAGALQLNPKATAGDDYGTSGDTYVAVGGDTGAGLSLGMQPGKRYSVTGWIYVPSATGLALSGSLGSVRGLRIDGFTRVGSNALVETKSLTPTATDQWQQLSMVLTVPTGATVAAIRLYSGFPTGSTGKTVYWDDLSVREVTGTTSTASITPSVDGLNTLSVQSRTASGLTSDWRIYEFLVKPVNGSWWWRLDEKTGSTAGSEPPDHPATLSTAGAQWSEAGRVGASAVGLDGTGDLATAAKVLNTSADAGFTVAAWVNVTDLTGPTYTAVSQDGGNASMFGLQLRRDQIDSDGDGIQDPSWCFTLATTDSTTSPLVAACTTDYVVPGDWIHVAGVYNKAQSKMTLYVNGAAAFGGVEVEKQFTPAAWSATGAFAIGRGWSGAATERWIGEIDEVRAQQKVATAEEISLWAVQ